MSGAAQVRLSVIMSTYNRPDDTLRFLEGLERTVTRPGVSWEVIVVDNNSSDHTPDVITAYMARAGYPLLRVTERRQGRSAGINAGIRAASGDYLAFTDDDVLVTPEWVQCIVDYLDAHPEVDCIGGMVRLYNPEDAPITINTSPHRAVLDFRNFTPHNTPIFGCNTAVRRALLDQIGFFDPELGVGTPTGAGEDVDLIYRFIAAGCQVHYVPEVVVDHNHGRRTRAQIRRVRRAYSHGLGAFYAKYFLASDRRIMKWAYWDIRDTLRSHALRALFLAKSREEILHLFQVLIGMSIYWRHRAHSRSPQG